MNSLDEFKQYLAQSSPWLSDFLEPFETKALRMVSARGIRSDYEPLLIEPLLEQITTLLARCRALRKEAAELELLATRAAMDFRLYLELERADRALEANGLNEQRMGSDAAGFHAAASMFGSANPGFAQLSDTLARAGSIGFDAARERRTLLAQRWDTLHTLQAAYHLRHTTEGNADNYPERMDRVLHAYVRDLAEAYGRCLAVARGLAQVYGRQARLQPCPFLYQQGSLDALDEWAAEAMRTVAMEAQWETALDLVIPLAQPCRSERDPLVPAAELKRIFSSDAPLKVLRFRVERILVHAENVRLRSVGLSFVARPPPAAGSPDSYASTKLRAMVHLPQQGEGRGPGGSYRRPPIALGEVAMFGGPAPVCSAAGPACHNASPWGEWRLVFGRLAVSATSETADVEGRFADALEDIKLHLRLIARPEVDSDTVFCEYR